MTILSKNTYGLLFTLDGYGADLQICADTSILYKVLHELPPLIQMRPLGEPHIVSIEETGIAGLSGFTFIFESHISIHTYSERGFVTADIYSCKDFDIEAAKEYLLSAFKITASEIHVYARGLRFNDPEFQVQLRPPKRV